MQRTGIVLAPLLRFFHAVHGEASRRVEDAAAEVEEVFHRTVSFLRHECITFLVEEASRFLAFVAQDDIIEVEDASFLRLAYSDFPFRSYLNHE